MRWGHLHDAWQGQGQFFKVKEEHALFVGSCSGIMFVETKQGALDASKIVCPGMGEVNLSDGTQSGEGHCIITARDGARVCQMERRWRTSGGMSRGLHPAGRDRQVRAHDGAR